MQLARLEDSPADLLLSKLFDIEISVELRHLRYFVVLAEELHFGRAASRLHISQPPLSQQIQRLEQELGVRLFRRTKRRVELTDAGSMFLEEAKLTLEQARHAAATARRAGRGEIGRLSVGYVGVTLYSVLPEIVRVFRERFPKVDLTLRELGTAEQLGALHARRIHVGFVFSPVQDEVLAVEPILREPFVAVLPEAHPLVEAPRLSLSALADEQFILFPRERRPEIYDDITNACRQEGFSPNIVHETTPQQTIVGLVATGMGIALVPACLQNLQRPGVVYKSLDTEDLEVETTLVWRKDNAPPVVQRFLEVIHNVTHEPQ